MMKTREQRFAKLVYERVHAFNQRPPNEADTIRYASLCHSMAIMIRSTGLVQAIAFVQRKQENAAFVNDLASVLGLPSIELLQQAYEAELMEYIYLTEDVLAALLWFKRFAQSILKQDFADMQQADQEQVCDEKY